MSVRNQLKLLVGGLGARRANRAPAAQSAMNEFLERSRVIAVFIFIVTVAAIVLISSAGVSTVHMPVVSGQIATMRVTALASFSYESGEKTRSAREQFADRIPPVYRLDQEPLRRFEGAIRKLFDQLTAFEAAPPPVTAPAARRSQLNAIAEAFDAQGPYDATPEDIAALLTIETKTRAALFDNGLATLRDVYAEGITDSALGSLSPGSAVVFQIARPNGGIAQRSVQSREEALTLLRVSLSSDAIPRPAAQAIFRLFRYGITTNVRYDEQATRGRQEAAAKAVKPVIVNVVRGQTIVEQGDRITPEQSEMVVAQRNFLRQHGDTELREGLTLFGRVLLVLAMVLASLIYIRIEDPETLRSNIRCGLLAIVVIVNLALVRANYSLGGAEFFVQDGSWASTLPYIAPTAFAPLIVAILIDAGSGIFMALLISIFTGVIYGNRLDLLVLTFLASLVTIFFGRDARRRGKVVRAAGAGGLTVAAFAALIGFADQTSYDTLLRQMIAGLGTGVLTGIAVVGLLPVLESLFKRTTDITLLELTDYNHPLLRQMQLEAPGTYHHSLVVAQLSENAANAIGANPLVARVCALFHDVGKTANPQYFGENQRDRVNPHADLAPAESARLIKQHVPDGVELALKHNLPRAVIEVIKQHHGTTLVRYFYHRAVEQSRAPFALKETSGLPPATAATAAIAPVAERPAGKRRSGAAAAASANTVASADSTGSVTATTSSSPIGPMLAGASLTPFPLPGNTIPSTVAGRPAPLPDERDFRYDGPRPQSKESAIISLADGVEATSRSVRYGNPDQLHELITRIVDERIAEGEMNEAPLTLEEITRVKNSFHFTLLNMLHSRVAYPPKADEGDLPAAVVGGAPAR